MWIVFGWQKEERPVAEVANAYCYDCRRKTLWVVWLETSQLGAKTPKQLKFIRESMDAEREYAERMKEAADREA